MRWLKTVEPARLYTAIAAVFILLATAGVTWASEDLRDAIIGVVAALIALVQGGAIRSAVVPLSKVIAYVDNPDKPSPDVISGGATINANDTAAANAVHHAAFTPYGKHSEEYRG